MMQALTNARFSRGAYTVRSLAGLISQVGICKASDMLTFWEMWDMYRAQERRVDKKGKSIPEVAMQDTEWAKEHNSAVAETFDITVKGKAKKLVRGRGQEWMARSRKNVTIEVVGVFDTVGYVDCGRCGVPWSLRRC